MEKWKVYSLGDFLNRQYESVVISNSVKYKRITIKSKGQGIELRDDVYGIDIRTKNQYRARYNQFLLSKIDAMNGAFGIVPIECDEGIITGNFWAYNIDEKIILTEFLRLLCVKQEFTKFSLAASEGTTNRKYLREDKFLNLSITLPPLPEQQRIVAKIEAVKQRVEHAAALRAAQQKDMANLLYSQYTQLVQNTPLLPMKEVAPIVRRPVTINETAFYPELGIRSFGKGTFHKPAVSGLDLGSKKIYQIKQGDLLFSNVFAWEGAIAVARLDDNDRFGSHRFISCLAHKDKALAEYLCFHFLTPQGLEVINTCSPGGAGRNKTLGLDKLMQVKVPIPPLPQQQAFVQLLHKLTVLKAQQAQTDNELAQLLPALLDKAFKGGL